MADAMKLVPVEPTDDMMACAEQASQMLEWQIRASWSAMLAASPPAREEAPAEGAGEFDGLEEHLAKLEASEVYAYESRIADLESEILTLRNRTSEPEAGELKPQVREISETLSAFAVMADHFGLSPGPATADKLRVAKAALESIRDEARSWPRNAAAKHFGKFASDTLAALNEQPQ